MTMNQDERAGRPAEQSADDRDREPVEPDSTAEVHDVALADEAEDLDATYEADDDDTEDAVETDEVGDVDEARGVDDADEVEDVDETGDIENVHESEDLAALDGTDTPDNALDLDNTDLDDDTEDVEEFQPVEQIEPIERIEPLDPAEADVEVAEAATASPAQTAGAAPPQPVDEAEREVDASDVGAAAPVPVGPGEVGEPDPVEMAPSSYQWAERLEPDGPLLMTAEEYRQRWNAIQSAFVDQPQDAVDSAGSLLAEVLGELASIFATKRDELESLGRNSGETSTEELRVAFRAYRSFFERLVAM